MKLVRLYSNLDHYFTPVDFNAGFNAVVAEIRHPENRSKSSHSLGKSTLARVIDFCLLGKIDKDHFFKKRGDLFSEFVFFLELQLLDGSHLTIRRSVQSPTRISFKKSEASEPDLSSLGDDGWTHSNLAFEKAQVRMAQAAMANRDTSVSELCKELGVRPVTLYRYVDPNGNLRDYGKRVLGA